MVFWKGSPYPIGTVNLSFCVGERRYAFGPEIHSVSQTADRPRSAGRFYLRQPPAAGYEAYLDKFRFRSLSDPQVWNSAVTNGIFVRFGDVEMSHNELFSMAEQEH